MSVDAGVKHDLIGNTSAGKMDSRRPMSECLSWQYFSCSVITPHHAFVPQCEARMFNQEKKVP